ncbi:hypothetical protein HK097_010833 [Rhizophlyctis rosea]|uniref:Uncharacterized protein n=1 Tax=Rhizophlyctis rosea TaxID=64517 RepID=A0AAD5X7C5_9FUNG|nr:hypothetical protein HK097_010833 [Rhizophlyctis rosea]
MAQSRLLTKTFGAVNETSPLGMSVEGSRIRDVGDPVQLAGAVNLGFVTDMINRTLGNLSYAAGTDLNLSGRTFKVDSYQPQIVTVATLQGLSVNGQINFTGSNVHVTAPSPTEPSDVCIKSYAEGFVVLPGIGLEKNGQLMNIASNLPQRDVIGPLSSLAVTGDAVFSAHVTVPSPLTGSDAASKAYADSVVVQAGTGLTNEHCDIHPAQLADSDLIGHVD